jgi:quinol monooxygenase YgiN
MSTEQSQAIHILVHATLRQDADQLRNFAKELCEQVARDEPGTVTYVWSVSSDESQRAEGGPCCVEERYADSEAFVKHMDGLRDSGQMRRLVKLLRVRDVFLLEGDLSLVRKELAPLDPIGLQTIVTI